MSIKLFLNLMRNRVSHCSYKHELTSNEPGLGVIVDLGIVDDGASLLGVSQCTQCLLYVCTGRADSGQHGCLRVTSQRLFQ